MPIPSKPTRAGSRVAKYRHGYGRIGSTRRAWINTLTTQQLALMEISEEERREAGEFDPETDEDGTAYVLIIPVPGRQKALKWDLTSMTVDELEAFKKFFDLTISLAEPVVRARDEVAQNAYEAGDDSYTRVYRRPPVFVDRQRPQRADSEGVHNGSEDDVTPDGSD